MHNIIRVFLSDARRLSTNVVAMVVIMGLAVIPCLYAWFNIFSNWDPYGQAATSQLSVAVASSDEGVEFETARVNVGNKVIDNLKANKSIKWVFTDTADEAVDGVRSGKYYAALVIDKNFTRDMVSFLGGNPEHPQIQYYENEKKNAIAPKITGKVKTTVQGEVNSSFVSTLAETLIEASQYMVATDNKKNISGNALDKMIRMDQDLSMLKNMLNAYISMIDSAENLAKASQAVTEEMDNLMRTGSALTDTANAAYDSAIDQAGTVSDLVTNSINQMIGSIMSLRNTVNTALSGMDTDSLITGVQATALADTSKGIQSTFDAAMKIGNYDTAADTKDQVAAVDASMEQLTKDLAQLDAATGKTKDDVAAYLKLLNADFDNVRASLHNLQNVYQVSVKPQVNETLDSVGDSIKEAGKLLNISTTSINELAGALGSYPNMMNMSKRSLEESLAQITDMQEKLEALITDMQSLNENEQYQQLLKLIETDPELIADFVSKPVAINNKALYAVENNGSGTAPFYLVLSIWVGALIQVAIVKTRVKNRKEFPKLHNWEEYFGRYQFYFLVGQLQTLITVLGALFFVQIQCRHPVLFYLACAITSFAFTMLMYSLTYAMGTVGEAACVVLMVLQVAGSGGTFPVEVLPKLYQVLYRYMPFQYAMKAVRECIGGMHGNDYWSYVGTLGLFVLFSIFLGLVVSIPCEKLNEMIEEAKEETDLMA